MLKTGILNPHINSLLSRVRHTNTLVIADRGFPFWPDIETIDISLVDDSPRVIDVLCAVRTNFNIGNLVMAEEFCTNNPRHIVERWIELSNGTKLMFEPHIEFKQRISQAIGIIRTGDSTPYSNVIVESA
ncbi:MAG TPA: D-ribose pyranase [Terracidiphilus sp.]|nr:D-ribose pyranase [Terracidiphilus sp.]